MWVGGHTETVSGSQLDWGVCPPPEDIWQFLETFKNFFMLSFIYLFNFGYTASLLLCIYFLLLRQTGAALWLRCVDSLQWALLLRSTDSKALRLQQ